MASASMGLGPHYAMQIAERLYTSGFISETFMQAVQHCLLPLANQADLQPCCKINVKIKERQA